MATKSGPPIVVSGAQQARYRAHAEICKVLTDPKRLMLIDLLRRGERSVGRLAEEAGLSLANTSQHLAVLRHAGLVDTSRTRTTIYYRLSEPELVQACDLIDRIVARRLGIAVAADDPGQVPDPTRQEVLA